ncbi:MAG: DNA-directed RNA polymerase subunit omega [bacterium]
MITTLPLSEFEKYTDNIYEAIIVLAKRARQINDQQKQLLYKDQEYDNYDEYDDDEFEVSGENEDYIKLPKPTSLAMEEFLSGQLEFKYREDETEEKEKAG